MWHWIALATSVATPNWMAPAGAFLARTTEQLAEIFVKSLGAQRYYGGLNQLTCFPCDELDTQQWFAFPPLHQVSQTRKNRREWAQRECSLLFIRESTR
ncbi:hypothetical protein GCM10022265_01970 [Marinobacter xestospongiae]